jgi:hypothetical protein
MILSNLKYCQDSTAYNTSLSQRLHFTDLNNNNLESFSLNLYFKLVESAVSPSPKTLAASLYNSIILIVAFKNKKLYLKSLFMSFFILIISCNVGSRKIVGTYNCGCNLFKKVDLTYYFNSNHTFNYRFAKGGEAGKDTTFGTGTWNIKKDTVLLLYKSSSIEKYKIENQNLIRIDSFDVPRRILIKD